MKAHLVNCTYCDKRTITPGNKKRSIPETERCTLTMLPIPRPDEPGRFCDKFHQLGHDCDSCLYVVTNWCRL
jgi:hypothetical protein